MKLWKWEKGRKATGYEKMLLVKSQRPIPFDCYLLKLPEGCEVPWHKDLSPQPGWNHYRINLVLKRALSGGDFLVKGGPVLNLPRLKVFRPDQTEHAVSKVVGGERLVLSIGFLIKRRDD